MSVKKTLYLVHTRVHDKFNEKCGSATTTKQIVLFTVTIYRNCMNIERLNNYIKILKWFFLAIML